MNMLKYVKYENVLIYFNNIFPTQVFVVVEHWIHGCLNLLACDHYTGFK